MPKLKLTEIPHEAEVKSLLEKGDTFKVIREKLDIKPWIIRLVQTKHGLWRNQQKVDSAPFSRNSSVRLLEEEFILNCY